MTARRAPMPYTRVVPDRKTFVKIPLAELGPEALRGVVEAFVGREGTDYGRHERSWTEKVADVVRQLEGGEACIVFDPADETTNIMRVEDLDEA